MKKSMDASKWEELEKRKVSASIDLGKIIEKKPNLSQHQIKILAFYWAKRVGVSIPTKKSE